jgi:hypothetical protein
MAIIKLQASEETTYEEACILASKLLEANSEVFQSAVDSMVSKRDRATILSKINKYNKLERC